MVNGNNRGKIMKKVFVYSLLTILAITGCQTQELDTTLPENNDESEVIIQDEPKVFTAFIDDDFNAETKTSLDGEGNVLWKMGDQVSIFVASTVNEHYQVTDASDGKTAASLNKVGGSGFVAGTEIDNNVAFYPYASTAEIAKSGSNYVISEIELPATQTYAEGSFGNGAFPMVAVTASTEDMNLKFKNVLGGLKLQLKGTATITSITVTGKNNEILYGGAEVTVSNGSTPSISLTNVDAKTVTLNCGAGVTLDAETATPFIIALPPMTMTGGFTVVITDTEGKEMEISTTKSQTITRSNLLRMPAVNYVGNPSVPDGAVDMGLSVMWGKYNIGASAPEQYGDYYAWGEVETKSAYNWSTYKFGTDPDGPFSKYISNSSYDPVDYKTVLEEDDDVAHVNLGGKWRIPTDEEWTELREQCSWEWTGNYNGSGIEGMIVTSLVPGYTDKSIFLPAAGHKYNANFFYSNGYYWSSTLYSEYPYKAWFIALGSSGVSRTNHLTCCEGISVRAVTE